MLFSSTQAAIQRRRKNQSGFTLVELIVAFTILLVLSSMAVPMARYQVRREREKELRYALREMHTAIDKYKDLCDAGKIQGSQDEYCYPPTLEILVEGVKLTDTVSWISGFREDPVSSPGTERSHDGYADWGKRSMQDDPDATSWGGQNVFDVYTKSFDKAADGTPYRTGNRPV